MSARKNRYGSASQRRAIKWRRMWTQEARCVCGRDLNPELPPLHPDEPTIDHVFAHSLKRFHGQNVTVVMHRRCNETKGQRPPNSHELEFAARSLDRLALAPTTVEDCKRGVYAMLADRWAGAA